MPDIVGQYLKAIGRGATGGEGDTMWPLLPSQALPYFEMEQAIEIYDLLQEYKKDLKMEEIAKLFRYPGVIRHFLRDAGINGLKVANKVGVRKFSRKEKVDHLKFLLDLISSLVYSDPFCLDDSNSILSKSEVNGLLDLDWEEADQEKKRVANGLYVVLFGWMWATHFNLFVGNGLEPHGPYDVSKKFGKGSKLLIRDFHEAYCPEIWNISKKLPFKKIRFFQVYKDVALGINFEGQIISPEGLGVHLTHFLVEADGKYIRNMEKLESIDESVSELSIKQGKLVDSLKVFEQIKKCAQISYYSLRGVYEKRNIPWWRPSVVEENIKRFGDRFVKSLGKSSAFSREYFRIVNDPRNDLLGEDALKKMAEKG